MMNMNALWKKGKFLSHYLLILLFVLLSGFNVVVVYSQQESQDYLQRQPHPQQTSSCPIREQLKSLVRDPSREDCHCDQDGFTEGWEISCLKVSSHVKDSQATVKHKFTTINSTFVKEARDTSTDGHHHPDLHESSLSFSIKSSDNKAIEVNCDESVPDFKPAMFQGKRNVFLHSFQE